MNPFSSRHALALALNLVGIGFIAFDFATYALRHDPLPVVVLGWLTCAAWLLAALLRNQEGRTRTILSLGIILTGSFLAGFTDLVGFVPAVAGLMVLVGQPVHSRRLLAAGVAGSLAMLLVGWVAASDALKSLVTPLSIMAIVLLAALSRRQYRIAERQSVALLEERLAVEEERALVAALSERSRIARDLHDVLAHSLGGLVIQLEAVDALLESGRDTEARARVIAARQLAVSGLDEAKQAVTALREPADEPASVVADLAATHRSLGGVVVVGEQGEPGDLDPEARTAFRRAVQELLTNARRHAPGVPTTLDLDWAASALTVRCSTPKTAGTERAAAGRSGTGGGVGLAGMRERVEGLGGSMSVRDGSTFEVTLTLPRALAPPTKRGAA